MEHRNMRKIHQEETPRGKWAKILLQMKGTILEVRLQPRRYLYRPQRKLHTEAKDRREEMSQKKKEEEREREKDQKKKQMKRTSSKNYNRHNKK